MCALVDRLGAAAGATELARMQAAFTKSALLEWVFWDSAWRLETWPDTTPKEGMTA